MTNEKRNVFCATGAEVIKALEDYAVANNITLKEMGQKEIAKALMTASNVELLGTTEMDGGLITGNLREEGMRVLDINEEIRKKKKDEEGV